MKIFVSHAHAHQTVTIEKEDFRNTVDRMTCFVNHRQHLSSAPRVTAQWIHEEIDHGDRNEDDTWAQEHGLRSSRTTWLQLLLSAQCAKHRDQHLVLDVAPLPRVISQWEVFRSNYNIMFS